MIIACPTCDSRYDVSGYPIGQQFRCRCGTVTTLQAPKREASMLACPHCGGGVALDAQRCEFCQTELLVKACPRCMARVFAAYEHCPECGAELQRAAEGTPSELRCPRCLDGLRAKLVGDVLIDECERCLGLWLDPVAIRRVIEDRQQSRAEALLGALPRAEVHAQKPGERMYIKCPCCQVLMNRRLFATGAGVIVDVCRTHGTFFDAGELPAIVDFVMKGGLEQAEKRDLERERQRLEREKEALSQMRTGGPVVIERSSYATTSHAFVDLLMALVK